MELERVTAEIRPRSDWESVDLGMALARRDFWRCLAVWWLAVLAPTVAAGWLLRDYPMLLVALFWWWKPAGSRMALFELSRRLFGERPGWRAVWREIPRVWWRRFFYRFCWARFSPWMPLTLAVEDLEGLRGKAYKRRAEQVARKGEGVMMGFFVMADLAAAWLGIALLAFGAMLLPDGQAGPWIEAWEMVDPERPQEFPLILGWTLAVCLMLAMSAVDVFVIGAGFGVYLNNRTWIEGWDVELAFKRLARRLGKAAAVWIAAISLAIVAAGDARAETEELQETLRPPSEVIAEVKDHKDFEVHKVVTKVPVWDRKPSKPMSLDWLQSLQRLGELIMVLVAAIAGGGIVWLAWRFRHVFRAGGETDPGTVRATARMVMGLEVTAHSLPENIPAAAMKAWRQGCGQEALSLLYRGAISKLIETEGVAIEESDTEGDCLRRVKDKTGKRVAGYFARLTGAWSRLAYARQWPEEAEMEALCEAWPFIGRRSG